MGMIGQVAGMAGKMGGGGEGGGGGGGQPPTIVAPTVYAPTPESFREAGMYQLNYIKQAEQISKEYSEKILLEINRSFTSASAELEKYGVRLQPLVNETYNSYDRMADLIGLPRPKIGSAKAVETFTKNSEDLINQRTDLKNKITTVNSSIKQLETKLDYNMQRYNYYLGQGDVKLDSILGEGFSNEMMLDELADLNSQLGQGATGQGGVGNNPNEGTPYWNLSDYGDTSVSHDSLQGSYVPGSDPNLSLSSISTGNLSDTYANVIENQKMKIAKLKEQIPGLQENLDNIPENPSFANMPMTEPTDESIKNLIDAVPGFKFKMEEGMTAVQNASSARGLIKSGRVLRELNEFGQGLAENTRQNEVNMAMQSMQMTLPAVFQQAAIPTMQADLINNSSLQRQGVLGNLMESLANSKLSQGQVLANTILGAGQRFMSADLQPNTGGVLGSSSTPQFSQGGVFSESNAGGGMTGRGSPFMGGGGQ